MTMIREHIIKRYQIKIREFQRNIKILKEAPLKEPLVLTVIIRDAKVEEHDISCACIPLFYGSDSIKCEMIGLEKLEYPFMPYDPKVTYMDTARQSIRVGLIKKWRKLDPSELPLLLGWEATYPALENLLKFPQTLWTCPTLMTKRR